MCLLHCSFIFELLGALISKSTSVNHGCLSEIVNTTGKDITLLKHFGIYKLPIYKKTPKKWQYGKCFSTATENWTSCRRVVMGRLSVKILHFNVLTVIASLYLFFVFFLC